MKRFIFRYRFFFFPMFAAVALFLFGSVLMLLWNWLMPDIFGLIEINFWQALGLFLLSRILFSGMGGKGCKSSGGWKKRPGDEKWRHMSPEERRDWFRKKRFEKWMVCEDESKPTPETTANDDSHSD